MDRQQTALWRKLACHVGDFQGAAKSLFDATGIDVYPETLQFLLRSYGRNGTTDAIRATQLLGEKADTKWTLGDIPGVQTFASKVINQDTVDFRQNYADVQKLVAERKYSLENDTLDLCDSQTSFHFLECRFLGALELEDPVGDSSSSARR
jgi:hypothetical protein